MKASAPRAFSGVLVLVLAAAMLLALNRAAGQRIPGAAVADWPVPPPVGSCVNVLSGSSGGVAVVPCTGPHDAEVTKAYSALDPVLTGSPSAAIDVACSDAARAYLGADADGDVPTVPNSTGGHDRFLALGLNYVASAAGAPAAERAGDRGWMICDIQPAQAARYSGSVRVATRADAPDAYRWCWSDQQTPVSCTAPHTAELLGTAPGYTSAAVAVTVQRGEASQEQYMGAIGQAMQEQIRDRREALNRGCAAHAADVLEVGDPTYGGLLRAASVDADNVSARIAGPGPGGGAQGAAGDGTAATLGDAGSEQTLSMTLDFGPAYCAVIAPDGRQLTRSLVGWGDQAPPVTAPR